MAVPVDSIIKASAEAVNAIGGVINVGLQYDLGKKDLQNQAQANLYNQTVALSNNAWGSVYNQQQNTNTLNQALLAKYSQPKSFFGSNPFQTGNSMVWIAAIAGAALLITLIALKR